MQCNAQMTRQTTFLLIRFHPCPKSHELVAGLYICSSLLRAWSRISRNGHPTNSKVCHMSLSKLSKYVKLKANNVSVSFSSEQMWTGAFKDIPAQG